MISVPFIAAAAKCSLPGNGSYQFFGIPHWWEYMKGSPDGLGNCTPVFSGPSDIFPIGLAILDILLRVAGFLAVVSIIIAGIEYIIAVGNPEKITNARKRIINSLVGLAIAFSATLIISFIGRQFV